MKEKLLDSLKCLLIATGIASIIVEGVLPPGSVPKIVFFGITFALILSGPGSALMVLSTYVSDVEVFILLTISFISFLFWLVLLRKPNVKKWVMYLPIVTWVLVGSFSTFWGLAAGV